MGARPLPESWARAAEQGLPNSSFLMGVSWSTSARACRQPPHHGTGQERGELLGCSLPTMEQDREGVSKWTPVYIANS